MQAADFYQNHLNRVSRSFAFCIARLESPLREWVGLTYLLCRALDTVEDAPWLNRYEQDEAYRSFESFLRETPDPERVQSFANCFPRLPEGELLLLRDLPVLVSAFHSLPLGLQAVLREAILSMSRGMRFYRGRRLQSLAEVNQYCFFVAGLVGDMLNATLLEAFPNWTVPASCRLNAHHFGLFLQKVNLLKDQRQDEMEGRFLVHSRKEVLESLKQNAVHALEYLRSLPKEARGYRFFCSASLLLGLESITWSERGWLRGLVEKIPRSFTEGLVSQLEAVLDDGEKLSKLFSQKLSLLPGSSALAQSSGAWPSHLYSVGSLSPTHTQSLGLA